MCKLNSMIYCIHQFVSRNTIHHDSYCFSVSKSVEENLSTVATSIGEFAENMRLFSLHMRALYTTEAVGGSSDAAKKLRKVRDATRNDAQVYLKGILPVCHTFVSSIKNLFEFYQFLNYDEWDENLEDILEEAEQNEELSSYILKIHESFLTTMKERQDEANIATAELHELTVKKKDILKNTAEEVQTAGRWVKMMNFFPVNILLEPLLRFVFSGKVSEYLADECNSHIATAALLKINNSLIPALKAFVEGLTKAAAFFSIVHNDLREFKRSGDAVLEKKKRRHFGIMQGKASIIMNNSDRFLGVLPDVRTDFEVIPVTGTDENYVDKWLQRQKALIEKECGITLKNRILKMLPWWETSGPETSESCSEISIVTETESKSEENESEGVSES